MFDFPVPQHVIVITATLPYFGERDENTLKPVLDDLASTAVDVISHWPASARIKRVSNRETRPSPQKKTYAWECRVDSQAEVSYKRLEALAEHLRDLAQVTYEIESAQVKVRLERPEGDVVYGLQRMEYAA